MRIAIVGLPGSGKSTLAMTIMSSMDLPWFDTDDLCIEMMPEALSGDNWVASGIGHEFYSMVNRADVLVYLDHPWHVCIARTILRCFVQFWRPWKNLTALYDLVFMKDIIGFNVNLNQVNNTLILTNPNIDAFKAVQSYIDQVQP